MEKYILDTCTWIEYFHDRNGVPEQARKVGRKNLCASEVTLAELTYGAINSSDYDRHIKEPQNKLGRTQIIGLYPFFSTTVFDVWKTIIILLSFSSA